MPLTQSLADFKAKIAQCDNLIASAHKVEPNGAAVFSALDQQQITIAAFLNAFISWEMFLESSLLDLMTGGATISGKVPVRYVSPPSQDAAQKIVIGVMRHFDYANHQNMIKISSLYFQNGYPYEPHLSAIYSDLDDLRTMRNASAHISSTTQTALESLANRIFAGPKAGISLYQMLTAVDPRSGANETVLAHSKREAAAASADT